MVDLYNESVAKGPAPAAKEGSWWMRRRCGSMSRYWSGRGLRGGCKGDGPHSSCLWHPERTSRSSILPATQPQVFVFDVRNRFTEVIL